MADMDPDRQPFLANRYTDQEAPGSQKLTKNRGAFLSTWLLVAAHATLIFMYGILGIILLQYRAGDASLCADREGHPNAALDERWEKLLSPSNIRVSETELRAANLESVFLPEGGGYMAWLGAFHALHCVNMLRKWVFAEVYHSNMSESEKHHYFPHVEHCLELLRQSAMCTPDLSLTTFKWHPNKTQPMFNASESVHQCVDWNAFVKSFEHRVLPEGEVASLQNPLMDHDG